MYSVLCPEDGCRRVRNPPAQHTSLKFVSGEDELPFNPVHHFPFTSEFDTSTRLSPRKREYLSVRSSASASGTHRMVDHWCISESPWVAKTHNVDLQIREMCRDAGRATKKKDPGHSRQTRRFQSRYRPQHAYFAHTSICARGVVQTRPQNPRQNMHRGKEAKRGRNRLHAVHKSGMQLGV